MSHAGVCMQLSQVEFSVAVWRRAYRESELCVSEYESEGGEDGGGAAACEDVCVHLAKRQHVHRQQHHALDRRQHLQAPQNIVRTMRRINTTTMIHHAAKHDNRHAQCKDHLTEPRSEHSLNEAPPSEVAHLDEVQSGQYGHP
jgi:hypothetical protein